jgi:hypothetical protein
MRRTLVGASARRLRIDGPEAGATPPTALHTRTPPGEGADTATVYVVGAEQRHRRTASRRSSTTRKCRRIRQLPPSPVAPVVPEIDVPVSEIRSANAWGSGGFHRFFQVR